MLTAGLQDSADDLGILNEGMPVMSGQPATQQPWTQQPTEPQLPQTQQQFSSSPGFDMVSPFTANLCDPYTTLEKH